MALSIMRILNLCTVYRTTGRRIVFIQNLRHASTTSESLDGEGTSGSSTEEDHAGLTAEDVDDVKEKILLAALEHVPNFGWSNRAIAEGAESVGLSKASSGLFSSGADLVLFFNDKCNYQLQDQLQQLKLQKHDDVIRTAIELRLRMIEPYLKHWPQAQSYLLIPRNMWKASQSFRQLLDIICHHAGLQTSDMTWYSRRATLSAIYKSTELAFIADKTPNFMETWAFLDRRIQEFSSYQSCESAVLNSSNVCRGGFITVANILGLNHLCE